VLAARHEKHEQLTQQTRKHPSSYRPRAPQRRRDGTRQVHTHRASPARSLAHAGHSLAGTTRNGSMLLTQMAFLASKSTGWLWLCAHDGPLRHPGPCIHRCDVSGAATLPWSMPHTRAAALAPLVHESLSKTVRAQTGLRVINSHMHPTPCSTMRAPLQYPQGPTTHAGTEFKMPCQQPAICQPHAQIHLGCCTAQGCA
jgi:hypothetical protein